jgi:hypothetical protein
MNHFIRALSSFLSGRFVNKINLKKVSNILFMSYGFIFLLIIMAYYFNNKVLTVITITLASLFIGLQLSFTILQIGRAHLLINENRGSLMSLNNLISRSLTAFLLITSKIIIDSNTGFGIYYSVVFVIFIIISYYLVTKINNLKEIEC